jgi:hypothetical protein
MSKTETTSKTVEATLIRILSEILPVTALLTRDDIPNLDVGEVIRRLSTSNLIMMLAVPAGILDLFAEESEVLELFERSPVHLASLIAMSAAELDARIPSRGTQP